MFKVNNKNTRTRCEICSKLTIKTPERCQWRRSGVFIVNFEHISHLVSIVNFEHVIAGWVVYILHKISFTQFQIGHCYSSVRNKLNQTCNCYKIFIACFKVSRT